MIKYLACSLIWLIWLCLTVAAVVYVGTLNNDGAEIAVLGYAVVSACISGLFTYNIVENND